MSAYVPGPEGGPLIPRHPMTLGDVISGAVALYRATFATAVPVVAVVYAPLAVLNAVAVPITDDLDARDPFAAVDAGELALLGLAMLVGFVVAPLVGAALTWLALARAEGRQVTWSEAYGAVSGLFGRVLLATLVVFGLGLLAIIAVAIPVGIAAMAGPGVAVLLVVGLGVPVVLVLLILSYLIVPAIVIEGARPGEAVARAWELLRVRLWPVIGTVVVAALLFGVVSATIGVIIAGVSEVAGPASLLVDAVGSTVSALVTVPLTTYVALLIYVDAAVRLEGPDALPLPPAERAT